MHSCLIHSSKTPLSLGLTGTEDVASYLFTAITRTQPTMLIVLLVKRRESDVNMRNMAAPLFGEAPMTSVDLGLAYFAW
jgi:hypothetical protein